MVEEGRSNPSRIDPKSLDFFAGEIKATIASLERKVDESSTRVDALVVSVDSLRDTTVEGLASITIRCGERLTRIEKLEKSLKNRGNSVRERSSRKKLMIWGVVGSTFSGLIIGLTLYAVGAV